MTKGLAPFRIIKTSEFDARAATALPANSQRMGFDSRASTRLSAKARIMPAIKRVAERHLDDAIAPSRLGGRQSVAPAQPSYQQRRKNNREQDPNDHALERAAQRERRRERSAPVAVRNRTRQVSRIAARPQAQRVATVAPDEHALR